MKVHILIGLALPFACGAAGVSWQFDGGSLDRVEKVAPDHFRVFVKGQSDQDSRNRQASWYFFRVDGAPRTALTFDILGLPGEYNYQPNRGAITRDTPPVVSYDGRNWKHVDDFEFDDAEPRLRLRIRPRHARFWVAHTPPYTSADLENLRKAVLRHPEAREQRIGKSVEGRDLLLWTIGKAEARITVWLMFRQHAWESGSSWTGDGAMRALLRDARLRAGVRWQVFPMADPDGVAKGRVRFNSNGYDLNRKWDVNDARLMPETAAQRAAMLNWLRGGKSIDLFLTLHNTETAEYLEGPPGRLAEGLFKALLEQTTFDPSRALSVVLANEARGRATVVQALAAEGKIPAFLMEQRIGYGRKLGHLPEVADRTRFGRELVQAIHSVVPRVEARTTQ
ncbi:MAG: M14-type cytosolic carboxypeptidase [Candidatus Solibacter sp.]|nr:M14-type cytosolic carboxypeptidase [Candidatus Solibacter sp.]